jgi:hypothetical protein
VVYEYDQPMAHIGRVFGARTAEGDPRPLPIPPDMVEGFVGQDTFPAVYRTLTDAFFASLRHAGPNPAPSFVDGLAAQKVIDAVARSAQTGKWEDV